MPQMNKESKKFPPKSFGDSPFKDVFDKAEVNIGWLYKTEQNAEIYSTFNDLFKVYLSKLPANHAKKIVEFVFKKELVYIGFSVRNIPIVFSRILLTDSNKVAAVVLDSSDLDISLVNGETNRIDDCIYAVYYGLIRAAILTGNGKIKSDKELCKNLVVYINQIILRALGKGAIYSAAQKDTIFAACAYLFHRHFLEQRHPMALTKVKNNYKDILKGDTENIISILDRTSKYSSMKDISKLLVDLKIVTTNPNQLMISLLKQLGSTGFYCLGGSLDFFAAAVILAKYPTGLLPKTMMISEKLHTTIENIIATKYLTKVEYDVTAIKQG